MFLTILGWIAWSVTAYIAITFPLGVIVYSRAGRGVQGATIVQSIFALTLAVVFILSSYSKLHLFWLMPLAFLLASFIPVPRMREK